MIGKKNVEEVKQIKFICTRAVQYGTRGFAAGEILEVEEGGEVPVEFMPLLLEGPNGTVETGPHFFCLKACYRNGREYLPGQIWDKYSFKEKPPEGLFALLSDFDQYELFVDTNRQKQYRLKSVVEDVGVEA